MVQKAAKFRNKYIRKAPSGPKGPKTLPEASWKNVKLSGPVISDDGADLAGFIGLEVLENYDRSLVRKEKKKKLKKDPILDDAEDSIEPQTSKRNISEVSEDSDDEEEERPKKQQKKAAKKVKSEAPVEESDSDDDYDDFSDDDSGIDAKPVPKAKKGKAKVPVREEDSEESEEESTAGRFVRLMKSQADEEKDEEDDAPKKKKKKRKSKKKQTNGHAETSKEGGTYSSADYFKWTELGVSDPIVQALADKGFRTPTEIQTLSLPAAIHGKRDLLGAAETGSGKTLAFGIPLLEGIMKLKADGGLKVVSKSDEESREGHELTPEPEELEFYPEMDGEEDSSLKSEDLEEGKKEQSNKPLYALILTPTRELAVQINDHLKAVTKYTDIQIATVFGGLAAVKQERMLKRCPEIVIATPGRFWELLQSGNPHLSKVDQIRFLVIDETDRMLERGHFDELKQLLEMLNKNEEATKLRRNYIFSATLTLDHDLPEHLRQKSKKNKKLNITKETTGQRLNNLIQTIGMTNPKVVDITQQHGTAQTLTESRILCKSEHKDYYLYYFLLRHPGRTLVFCNSIDCVKRLVSLFTYLNCDPLSLFGSMQQRQRLKNLERFTANPAALLIATDVAARGLDIPNVDHVIHYQVPKTTENYVHRSGRTARASREGIAVLLTGADEVKDYVKLNQALGRKEDLPMYPTSDRMMKQVRERVNLAREIEKQELRQRRDNESRSWEDKVAKEFQSDSEVDSEQEERKQLEKSREKRAMKARRLELSRLLATPIVMDRVEMKFPTSAIAVSLPAEKEGSAIKLVRQVVEENIQLKKQRNKKKKKFE